jgi:hypothetical protein
MSESPTIDEMRSRLDDIGLRLRDEIQTPVTAAALLDEAACIRLQIAAAVGNEMAAEGYESAMQTRALVLP